jgi:tetratricopeptide (TPR) repeat protein
VKIQNLVVFLLTVYPLGTNHYWRSLGAVYQQLKNYQEAIAAYEKAIADNEKDIVSYIYNGETHILSGDVNAGVQILEQTLKTAIENSLPQPDP